MTEAAWEDLIQTIKSQGELVIAWQPDAPKPEAERCLDSRHRTLGHLRACQEQWLIALQAFLKSDNSNVTFLHPWRHFESQGYASTPWDEHMDVYCNDRKHWLELISGADRTRSGKWNRKPDTVEGLTKRLMAHEAHHILNLTSHQMLGGK